MTFQADRRFAHIDCLRAIGALAVFCHHIFHQAAGQFAAPGSAAARLVEADRWFDAGRFGVDLFFIVSGWVIPYSLMGRDGGSLPAFAVNRAFRLFPMYWVALTLVVVCFGDGQSAGQIALNYTLLHRFIGVPEVLGLSWTLQVELVFYALAAALFGCGLLHRPAAVLGLAGALVGWQALAGILMMAGGPRLPLGWPTFLALMVCGTTLRFADEGLMSRRAAVLIFLALIPARLTAVLASTPAGEVSAWLGDFLPVALPVVLFLAVDARKTLTWRPLAWIGTVSYSLYLLHPIVAQPVFAALRRSGADGDAFAATLLVLAAVLACSWAGFRLVEQPFIRLGRKLAARTRPAALQPA